MKVCTIDGCDRRRDSLGFCGMHAKRFRRTGDPLAAKWEGGQGPAVDRFWKKVIKQASGCWEWQAATTRGYGVFWDGSRLVYAHRWLREQMVGPIPEDLVIDHLCRNPLCVNPEHTEPVTRAVNTERGARWGSPTELLAR